MNRKYNLTMLLLMLAMASQSQTLYLNIAHNTYVNAGAANVLTLSNTSLASSGSFVSKGKVVFAGNQPTSLGGASKPAMNNISVQKQTSLLTLTGDAQVTGALRFEEGLVDLNQHNLQLQTSGSLFNETETSHLTGVIGGLVTANVIDGSFHTGDNIGNLGVVLSTANNPGNVTISRSHKPFENPGNSGLTGIQRSYLIQPSNNSSLNATLRFYYLDAELNGKDENTLTLWQSPDGVSWTNVGVDARNTTANFVEKSGISSLMWFTLSDASHVLPVTLLSFKATCQNAYTLLQWQTGSEVNAASFIIEKSVDGNNWKALQTVAPANTLSGASYSYKDVASQATAYYHIKLTDKNGNASYSPVFSGGCSEVTLPFTVYPNPAHSHATASFAVRQSGNALLQLYSLNGKLLFSQKQTAAIGINSFVIPVANLSAGTYIVKLFVNGQTLQTKLVKD